ncbi:hypothetical protein DTL42_05895 [Bremerella cremea]|uniref:Uncharacterized protein n=1 Tax=Bremerella cremea TaxID=1031537 RepID=A0A368KWC4_9BACT|nr:hypothetical protein [Bremerella cremea]RCS54659.1 hypothetical protein DTL42_05895 [Bremerella cremea]
MQSPFNSQEIERLVRLVVERLVQEGANVGKATAQPALPAGELRLDSKLITISSLKGKLNEATTVLCVPTKAVVTPAVKDELKDRGIRLRRADQADCGFEVQTPVVVNAAKQTTSPAWNNGGRSETIGNLKLAVQRATALAGSDKMVVILSEQPEVIAVAANRQNGIRAMVACESHDWKSAAESLGANVIACHPGHWNDNVVPRLLNTLWNLRGTAAPDWLK